MSGRVQDGAGISLGRQLSMIRFIMRNNKKGVRLGEVQFHMTINYGMSDEWVVKYLRKWSGFGVVTQKGTRFRVNEEKWALVQRARDEEATQLEG